MCTNQLSEIFFKSWKKKKPSWFHVKSPLQKNLFQAMKRSTQVQISKYTKYKFQMAHSTYLTGINLWSFHYVTSSTSTYFFKNFEFKEVLNIILNFNEFAEKLKNQGLHTYNFRNGLHRKHVIWRVSCLYASVVISEQVFVKRHGTYFVRMQNARLYKGKSKQSTNRVWSWSARWKYLYSSGW